MGYNHIHICGHLGRDPEAKQTQSGKTMCKLNVAVTKHYNGQENTTWFKVVCFGELADRCIKGLTKGCKLSVHGEMECRSYDHNGETKYDWSILMRSVEFHTRPERKTQPKPKPQVEALDPWTWDKTENPAESDYKWETLPAQNHPINSPWKKYPSDTFTKD